MTIQIAASASIPTDTFRSTCNTTVNRGTGNCAILVLAQFGGSYSATNLVSCSITGGGSGSVAMTAGSQSSFSVDTGSKFRAFWLADASVLSNGTQTITITASDGNAKIGFYAVVITDTGGGSLSVANETINAIQVGTTSTVFSSNVVSASGNAVVSMVRSDSTIASTPISPTTQFSSASGSPYRQEVWLTPSSSTNTTASASGWSGAGIQVSAVSLNISAAVVTAISGNVTEGDSVAAGSVSSASSSVSGNVTKANAVAAGNANPQWHTDRQPGRRRHRRDN